MAQSSINNSFLLIHNKRGIFPFPGEGKGHFLKRVKDFSLKEEQGIKNKFSFEKIKKLFDIAPVWAKLKYTNQGLKFWEAALLEVDSEGNQYTLKLKKGFERKNRYLGLYDKEEVIAHECCHLGRMAFDEPKYEEIFAYHTSKGLRRVLGPIFSSPRESLILMFFLSFSILGDFIFPISIGWAFKAGPLLYLLYLGGKLFLRHLNFNRCKRKLRKIVRDPSKVLAVMFRLSDEEINSFSRKSKKEISEYIQNQNEVRWEVIKNAYLNEGV